MNSQQPLRRARAGTMPSLAYMNQPPIIPPNNFINSTTAATTTISNGNRHRSGSLTLPKPASLQIPNMYSWGQEPISPSTEQLLQGDDDFSIARTLRSIGLDEENDNKPRHNSRSRSYSVNNTMTYQQDTSRRMNNNFNPPLDSSSVGNRPRASSMGRMDYSRITPPGLSSLWKMQLGTLHDEEYDSSEPSLSLGDSELLANMISIDNTNSNNLIEVSFFSLVFFFFNILLILYICICRIIIELVLFLRQIIHNNKIRLFHVHYGSVI